MISMSVAVSQKTRCREAEDDGGAVEIGDA